MTAQERSQKDIVIDQMQPGLSHKEQRQASLE
jgi:hypothetical protein